MTSKANSPENEIRKTRAVIFLNLNSFSTGHNNPTQHDASYASWYSDWSSYADEFNVRRISSGSDSKLFTVDANGNISATTLTLSVDDGEAGVAADFDFIESAGNFRFDGQATNQPTITVFRNQTTTIDLAFTTLSSREDMVNVVFDTLSPEIRSMLMNADQGSGETKTLVYAWQPYINIKDATGLRDTIDEFLSEGGCDDSTTCYSTTLAEEGVTNSKLTGGLPISIDITSGIHKAQSETTVWTMIILLFTMAVLFRSPRLAIFTMTAVAVVVLWQPLLMRGGSVNVNVFTAMIGTIVFGIGVDDSIHIIDRIRDEGETPAGVVRSVVTTGRTIFETTATTCAGLSAGLFVAIPGLQNFFLLMMALIALALLTSSILLPTIIVVYNEFKSRITLNGPWLDYDDGGTISESSVLKAIVDSD